MRAWRISVDRLAVRPAVLPVTLLAAAPPLIVNRTTPVLLCAAAAVLLMTAGGRRAGPGLLGVLVLAVELALAVGRDQGARALLLSGLTGLALLLWTHQWVHNGSWRAPATQTWQELAFAGASGGAVSLLSLEGPAVIGAGLAAGLVLLILVVERGRAAPAPTTQGPETTSRPAPHP
jgi:hypothetical protein